MQGINAVRLVALPDVYTTYQLFAIADFDGAGTTDLVFKKPDGSLVVWLMNAASPTAPIIVNNAGTASANTIAIEP